jgi:hypothetical protein
MRAPRDRSRAKGEQRRLGERVERLGSGKIEGQKPQDHHRAKPGD